MNQTMPPDVRRGVASWIVKAVVGLVVIAIILFLIAGRWDWLWGWLFIGLLAAASVVHVVVLIPTNPALLAKRARGLREEGATKLDKFLTGMGTGLLPLIGWIMAALDLRFGWSSMPLLLHLVGAAGFALGWTMALWATASNAFFTTTVHIQEGQTVQTGGPYGLVRHPGYAGAILYQLATPFLLGSWWAFIPMVLAGPFLVVRTGLEDRMLHEELAGYREYAQRVRHRLWPGVW